MKITNIHQAKTHLSKLIERAVAGDSIIIAKAGTPIVQIIPYTPPKRSRTGGQWRGKVRIADDFDELPVEFLKAFYPKKQ